MHTATRASAASMLMGTLLAQASPAGGPGCIDYASHLRWERSVAVPSTADALARLTPTRARHGQPDRGD